VLVRVNPLKVEADELAAGERACLKRRLDVGDRRLL
jgi:hypothetical protein